ncbi:MAG: large subunit ribosomal protein [Solirubrobacteraceae bacterium]|jgi:large subunit ribosomal protein L29|nr:large subunit ribosomal protein [Solirubrobacteraceae bacterium]
MRTSELREISDQELVEHIRTARREIFGLRFQHATGELENTAGMGASRKDLARALTIAHQRGIDTENL